MTYTLELSGALLAIYLISVAFKHWSRHSRYQKAVSEHGCKPASRYPNWEPFLGLDLFAKIRKADALGKRSQAYLNLHKTYGQTFCNEGLE